MQKYDWFYIANIDHVKPAPQVHHVPWQIKHPFVSEVIYPFGDHIIHNLLPINVEDALALLDNYRMADPVKDMPGNTMGKKPCVDY